MTPELECRIAKKNIKPFLDDELDIKSLRSFLNHIDRCEDCKEELSIQFLVEEGLSALEDGDSYDLQTALNERLRHAHWQIRLNSRLFWVRNFCIVLVVVLIFVFIWMMQIYL